MRLSDLLGRAGQVTVALTAAAIMAGFAALFGLAIAAAIAQLADEAQAGPHATLCLSVAWVDLRITPEGIALPNGEVIVWHDPRLRWASATSSDAVWCREHRDDGGYLATTALILREQRT